MEVIECLNDDKFEEWGGQWTSKVDTIKEVIEANLEGKKFYFTNLFCMI